MRRFLHQWQWELRRLAARPRTYIGFAGAVVCEGVISALLRLPLIRATIARDLWGSHIRIENVISGLTTAAHILGETMTAVGIPALALVGGEIIAAEAANGSLRMVLCRPVKRSSLFLQKLLTCVIYAVALSAWAGATSLAIGLLCEGRGPLLMTATHESIIGRFDFGEGLQRYALATALLAVSASSGILISFFFSCCRVAPATATILALTVFFADDLVRVRPEFSHAAPYCLSTRLLSWRQVFNDEIPWARIQRHYTAQLWMDGSLIVGAWLIFRRREFKP